MLDAFMSITAETCIENNVKHLDYFVAGTHTAHVFSQGYYCIVCNFRWCFMHKRRCKQHQVIFTTRQCLQVYYLPSV